MPNIVGSSFSRVDALAKVTGQAVYPSDYSFPDMLHLRLVRSTQAHARIKQVDTQACNGIAGLFCFTAQDVLENSFGNIIKDQPMFAEDKVRFYGEAVALIAADTPEKADRYAKVIKVEYEPLAVVNQPEEASKADSPLIHETGNLLADHHFLKGDVEEAFRQSTLIMEDTFSVPVVDHAYLEREAGVSFLDDEGVLNIIAGTQNPFYDREEIARCLGIPSAKIRMRAATIGGAFGGKDGNTVQLFLALVTWQTRRPARLLFTREESLTTSYKRHAAKIEVKLGLGPTGLITAYRAVIHYDTGAYAALGPAVLGLGVEHAAGPYVVPNVQIDGYLWYTNKPPASAMRGFGVPQVAFAVETLLNRAAKILPIDPLKLRWQNALFKGAEGSLGHLMEHSVGLQEALELMENSVLWRERSNNTDPTIGYGMAAGYLSCGMGKGIVDKAKVEIEALSDGTYAVRIGTVEIGQGSHTLFIQLASEALNVPPERIRITMGDTALTYDSGSTAGSRTSYICGNALLKAAADLHRQTALGTLHPKGVGEAVFPEVQDLDLGIGFPHSMYTFIAEAVKVKLNPLTGEILLLDILAIVEAGRVINPKALEGQIQGGVSMGIGYALLEQMQFDQGVSKQTDLSTYLLPTSFDSPSIQVVCVPAYEESGPRGLKGAAEVGAIAIAPAILAAVNEVVDLPISELPLSAPTVMDYLIKHRKGGG
ncbi:MAG TPA: xanthine dehydrogenase family protein molybdopterin-binding subunit [Desulfosporosinus sp.]|nr:xanthine dehydrogenase family protein molybdopterin-binding subunit [Desulfosporosinus sp.]